MNRRLLTIGVVVLVSFALVASTAHACTAFRIQTRDGAWILGRSMEFAIDMKSDLIVVPRGELYVGTAPNNQQGLAWKVKYGFVGMNAFDVNHVSDGLNETGLAVSLLWFPDYAKYPDVKPEESQAALAPWEVGTWALSTCSSVNEFKQAVGLVKVWSASNPLLGDGPPPLHFIAYDASGECVVVEYVDGQLKVHDNPTGVLTNSPPFDWHLANLRNYLRMSPFNAPATNVDGLDISGVGQGTGMLGLPGDYTPPSRFIRAVFFSQSAESALDADRGVNLAIHLLNTFDIPRGLIRERTSPEQVAEETTQWITVRDLTNKTISFRTYDNLRIRQIDLKKIDFTRPSVRKISLQEPVSYEDVTNAAQ